MRSFQENLSIFTDNSTSLLIQIAELNELREQLRKAQQSARRVRQSKRRKRTPIEHAANPCRWCWAGGLFCRLSAPRKAVHANGHPIGGPISSVRGSVFAS